MNNPICVCVDRNPFSSVDELVATVARAGFDRIEWFEFSEEELWTSPAMAARICALLRRHGLSVQYHAPYEKGFDLARVADRARTPEESAALLSRAMDRAERLGARLMTVHLGSCPPGVDRVELLQRVADGVLRAVPELERRGIRLALENHTQAIIDSSIGDHPQDFEWLMAHLRSDWVGRTLDIGHAHINSHLDAFLAQSFDRVFNIHLHDNNGQRDEHLPLGAGTVPWEPVLRRIAGACYSGPLTFEFFAPPAVYAECIARARAVT